MIISKAKPGQDAPLFISTCAMIRRRKRCRISGTVRKKMQDIAPSLPEGAQGPDVNDEFDDTFGTIYGFIPEGYTLREVRDRVETLRRELMSLPDIGKTTLLGEQQEQMVLAFSPARLAGWVWIFSRWRRRSGRRMQSSRRASYARGRRTSHSTSAVRSPQRRVYARSRCILTIVISPD